MLVRFSPLLLCGNTTHEQNHSSGYGENYLWQRSSSGLSMTWPYTHIRSPRRHLRLQARCGPCPFVLAALPSIQHSLNAAHKQTPLSSPFLICADARSSWFPSRTDTRPSVAHRWETKPTIYLVYKNCRYESKMGHSFISFSAMLPTAAASYGSRDAPALVRIGSREVLEERVERDRVYELTRLHPRIFFTACIVSHWDASMECIGRSLHWTCMEVVDGFTECTRTRAEMVYILDLNHQLTYRFIVGLGRPITMNHAPDSHQEDSCYQIHQCSKISGDWSVSLAMTHLEYRGDALLLDMDAPLKLST
ncbi:hypothetical protein NP233_g12869 [Leucocoprinus birnbaumii]|uniref:Uncharacterized protein n=1 Tax=Leucocoprinus birnbaumii TaxID=56174 RepID=A0AAD5YPK8_9AGAR|nr:hypothetical protein NP233_g12869 [Leucocoprinus birnbaumii]